MNREEQIDAIHDIAQEVGGRVHKNYSGRGMFGQECYSIYCDDANACLEQAGSHGLFGARTDSMGLGAVVYWPHIKSDSNES